MRANATNPQSGRGAGVAAGLVLFLTISSAAAAAVTFTVTRTTDDNGPCAPDDCSLREAIIAANGSPGPDSIILPGGTYTLSIPGPEENVSLTGDLDVRGDLEIEGDEETPVIIVGDGSDRVLHIYRSSVTISNVTITGGVAEYAAGGIWISFSDVIIRNSTITGNRAVRYDGGGVSIDISDTLVINSTISGNHAPRHGGGIHRRGAGSPPTPPTTLINTTISGNSAGNGGGIFDQFDGDLILINCTVANNTASFGSALYNRSGPGPTLGNSLIVGECHDPQGADTRSYGGNIQSPDYSCWFKDPTDRMNVADVMLGPLADNGGPTMTHALLPGSPAMDSALQSQCPETDQRGVARPLDGDWDSVAICDVGAYEAPRGRFALEVPALAPGWLVALGGLLAGAALVSLRRRRGVAR